MASFHNHDRALDETAAPMAATGDGATVGGHFDRTTRGISDGWQATHTQCETPWVPLSFSHQDCVPQHPHTPVSGGSPAAAGQEIGNFSRLSTACHSASHRTGLSIARCVASCSGDNLGRVDGFSQHQSACETDDG